MNILMIDDESNLLKLLRWPLTKYGHSITEALDGKQGWDFFLKNTNKFDVIITDIKMPVLDGVELLRRLREKEYDIPVIVMSGCEDIQASIQVLRLGAFDFLLKPFKAKELIEILEKLEAVQENRKRQFEDLPLFNENIEIIINSRTQIIPAVGSLLRDRVKLFCNLHKINIRNIGLCLHEAIVNAVVHGNLEISSSVKNREDPNEFEALIRERESDPEYADRQVVIRCWVNNRQLVFEIEDEGNGFDPEAIHFPNPLQMIPSGRGILIIMSFMDNVYWNETGNCITMVKELVTPQFQPEASAS